MTPSDPVKMMMMKEGCEGEQRYEDVPPVESRILFFPSDDQFMLLVKREREDWEAFTGDVSEPEHLEYFLDPGSLQDEEFVPSP